MTNPLLNLPPPTPDPIFAIAHRARMAGPGAINGAVGMVMDEEGNVMIFPSVRSALKDIGDGLATRWYGYPKLSGLPEYRTAVSGLIFGAGHQLSIASTAGVGGSGAVALNLRLLSLLHDDPTVILPVPTWTNQGPLCRDIGMKMSECAHVENGKASIEGILQTMKKTKGPCGVVLHVCCHNSTGLDLSRAQWEELLPLMKEREAVALFDFAYQGFASDPEIDAWPVRRAVELGLTTLVAWSASKNHTIYSERAGLACAVAPDEQTATKIEGHYMALVRRMHSSAATFGQSVVVRTQEKYKEQWLKDLGDARTVMDRKRAILKQMLPAALTIALDGRGMFGMLALTSEQIDRLETEQNVFLTRDGRINIAGIPLHRMEELAENIRNITQ